MKYLIFSILAILFFNCSSDIDYNNEEPTILTDTIFKIDTVYLEKVVNKIKVKEVYKSIACNTTIINLENKSDDGVYNFFDITGRTEINLTSKFTDKFGNLTFIVDGELMYNITVISKPTGVIIDGFYGVVPTQKIINGKNIIKFTNLDALTDIKIILS